MISYLLGLLLKKRLPLRQPCRARGASVARRPPPRALPCRPKRRLSQAVADAYVLAAGSRHPSEPCPVSLRPQPDVCTGCVVLFALSNPIINKQVVTFADRRRDVFSLRNPSHHRVFEPCDACCLNALAKALLAPAYRFWAKVKPMASCAERAKRKIWVLSAVRCAELHDLIELESGVIMPDSG